MKKTLNWTLYLAVNCRKEPKLKRYSKFMLNNDCIFLRTGIKKEYRKHKPSWASTTFWSRKNPPEAQFLSNHTASL